MTQETTLYIRIVGNSLHRGLDEVEGFYGVHFLIHPSFHYAYAPGNSINGLS